MSDSINVTLQKTDSQKKMAAILAASNVNLSKQEIHDAIENVNEAAAAGAGVPYHKKQYMDYKISEDLKFIKEHFADFSLPKFVSVPEKFGKN